MIKRMYENMDLQKWLGDWKSVITMVVLLYGAAIWAADQRYERLGSSERAVRSDFVLDYELKECDKYYERCDAWEHAKYKIYKKQLKEGIIIQ